MEKQQLSGAQGDVLDKHEIQRPEPTEAMIKMQKRVKDGTIICYIIGALTTIASLFGLAGYLESLGYGKLEFAINLGVGVAFIVLGVWSRTQAIPALSIAVILYCLALILSILGMIEVGRGASGLLIQGLLLGLLMRSWINARRLRALSAWL